MPTAHIHLGIHKTATTYLQDQIYQYTLANESNFEYTELSSLRKHLTYKIRKPYASTKGALKKIFDLEKDILISDENLLGGVEDLYKKGQLYSNTESVIGKLCSALPNHKVKIIITLREPLTYFTSMYCEYLRHFHYISFDEYTKHIDLEAFKWSDIFLPVFDKYHNLEFYINDFSNFKNNKVEIVKLLSFDNIYSLSDNVEKSRQTLTKQAIQFISTLDKKSHMTLRKMESSDYIFGEKYSPFPEEKLIHSKDAYNLDLERISKVKNVTMV